MAQQTINTGVAPNDGTGDTLKTSFTKCNANFTELYAGGASLPYVLKAGDTMIGRLTLAVPSAGSQNLILSGSASVGINYAPSTGATTGSWTYQTGNILSIGNDTTDIVKIDLASSTTTFVGSTGVKNSFGGDGLNLSGGASQGLIAGAGASADVGVAITAKGNSAVYIYNANFARLVSQFAAAATADTSLNFTTQPGLTQIGNNPAGNPINFLSPVTMSGDLTITKAVHPGIILNKTAAGQVSYVGGKFNGLNRWQLQLGNDATESGGNTGSDCTLLRMNDAGVVVDTPLTVSRATGIAAFGLSPTAPTPLATDSSTKMATTEWVRAGIIDGSNAASGKIGEYIETTGGALGFSNTVTAAAVSMAIPAGDWDIWGAVSVTAAAGTGGYVTISDTIGGLPTTAGRIASGIVTSGGDCHIATPTLRKNFTVTTTMYITFLFYANGNVTTSVIRARRVR